MTMADEMIKNNEIDKVPQQINDESHEEKVSKVDVTDESIEAAQQQSTSTNNTLPNLYNKFVTSFENAIHDLIQTEEEPKIRQKLPATDLEGVATFIREEQPSIVFMVGAGISTSAGIPDFRTPGTGLYDNLSGYNIPNPHAIFDINYFKKNPEPFYVLCKELFRENIKPTPTHYFIKLVDAKGLLRRCFTQNIDSLEYMAGIKDDKIVAAHGSHRTSTCLSCKRKYDLEWFMARLKDPNCKVPRCETCKKGIVKPDIIFFGENLPTRFFSSSLVDLPKCELLIIIGTSLIVHPFAALVENVPADTPRLLINLTESGQHSLCYNEPDNVRDVFWQGECDAGVFRLARLLGWEQELNALIKAGSEL